MGNQTQIKYQFARELVEWSRTGKEPESANQDVRYFLDLQEKRLKERGVHMEYELERPKDDRDISMGGIYGRAGRDSAKYESYIDYRNYTRQLSFYRGGKKKFSKKAPEVLYVTTTWLKEGEITGEETYCCPSCGAISTIRELQEGCPYCKTRFVMSDLFPKVTDFLYARDYAEHGDLKQRILRFVIIGAAIGMLAGFLSGFGAKEGVTFAGVIGTGVFGALAGYVAWAFGKIGSIFGAAAGSVGMQVDRQGAKKRITELLGEFDPGFSFDYFLNQILSTVKIIIFAKDRTNLVQYVGRDPHPEFDEILECTFRGKMKLNYHQVQNGYATISVNIEMDDVRDRGGRVFEREDVFCVTMVKNIMRTEEPGFSIKKVQCAGCGGSFDATKERHCPYCGAVYDFAQDGWLVTDIRKVK